MSGFGGAVKLTGADEYKNALKQISQNLREVSSQMSVVSSSFDKNDNSASTLKKKQEQLNEALEQQKSILKNVTSSYSYFSSKVQEQAQKHNKLTQEYEEEKNKLQQIKQTSGEASTAYQEQLKVVTKLAVDVAKSTTAYNDNEIALSKLKVQMNNAQAQVNKTTQEINELGNETKETGEQVEKSSEGFTVLKGVLSNLTSKAITTAISGLKELGNIAVDVGKQALESYADYEQLVGGVETLFKDSSKEVEKYANNAYKTAGLSANEYMETVTSFSASLLQGLNGDTAKTAQIANLAITDMSDNANKMGSSMETIQNAYQGFAKQNYTMLDNLKLGYGGTQSEMIRLINDSGILNKKIKKLDGITFDQIIKAIHKVQENMGITGTTAKEASETISGSTASMKSAWQNLLTGIADDTQDLGKLIDKFIDSVLTASDNVVPRVKKIVQGIKKLVNNIIENVFPKLKKEIPELKPLIETFEWFIDNKTTVANAIKVMVSAFAVAKISSWTKTMSDVATSFLTMIANARASAVALNTNTTAQVANTTAQVAGTTATGALTTATNLLNMAWKSNPIGLVVTAVTALIAVISLLKNKTDEATEAEKAQQEALKEQTQQIQDNKEAWDDLAESQQNQINTGMTEISHYSSLYDELSSIVDANGKVKDGYQERASFIASTLSEALGIEIKMVDGVIKKYGDLKSTIDEVMEKKKAQIILDSQESLYSEAITKQTEALKLFNETEEQLSQKRAERFGLEQQLREAEILYMNSTSYSKRAEHQKEMQEIKEKMAKLDEETATLQGNYDTQKGLLEEYAYNIGLYESNMALAHAGNYEQMSTVTWDYVKDYQGAGEAEKAMLESQIKTTESNLNLLKELKDKSNSDIYDSQIKSAEKQLETLKGDLKKYESATEEGLNDVELAWSDSLDDQLSEITGSNIEFKDAGDGNVQMYVNGVASGKPKSKEEMASLVKSTILEVSKQETDATQAGKDLITGINNGIGNQSVQGGVFATIKNFGFNLLAKLKASLQEHSPSKATNEMGQYLLEGLGLGIDKKEKSVLSQVSNLGKDIISSFNNSLDSNSLKNSLSSQIQASIPTNIDANATLNKINRSNNKNSSNNNMVSAFKEALKDVKVVMNDREFGSFVTDTMERVVYS